MSFEDVLMKLQETRWGSAPDWDDRAKSWLWTYYERIEPIVPVNHGRIAPAAQALVDAVIGSLSEESRARVVEAVAAIGAAAAARGDELESTTRDLLPLVLAWGIAVDEDRLPRETDPGAPLVELFQAGFQIQYRHEGILLHYLAGWRIYQVPKRRSV